MFTDGFSRINRYGNIGMACAKLAKVYGMRILALRRNPEQSRNDCNIDEVLTFVCELYIYDPFGLSITHH